MDDDGNRKIDLVEFKRGLRDYGVDLEERNFNIRKRFYIFKLNNFFG